MRLRSHFRPPASESVMFKVECPGCKANYNVDERRVPPTSGMKMRCPKCSTTFMVRRPGDGDDLPAVAGADLPAVRSAAPSAPAAQAAPPPARARKQTVLGLGIGGAPTPPPFAEPLSGAKQEEPDDLLPAVHSAKPLPARKPEPAALGFDDLPVTAAPKPAPRPTAPKPAPRLAADPFSDLPSPIDASAALPATKKPAAPKPGKPLASPAVSDLFGEALDLPAVSAPRADLPAPIEAPRRGGAAFGTVDFETDLPVPTTSGLPVVRNAVPSAGGFPTALGATRADGRQITGGALFEDLDLNVGADLPSPIRGGADLPALPGFGAELPAISTHQDSGFGEIDLPIVQGGSGAGPQRSAGLPQSPSPFSSVPAVSTGGLLGDDPFASPAVPAAAFGSDSLGLDEQQGGASLGADPMGADPFDFSGTPLPPADEMGFDAPLDFPSEPGALDDDPFAAPAPATTSSSLKRGSGGGLGFGEVELDASAPAAMSAPPDTFESKGNAASSLGWGERDLGGGDDDDMEFGAIPQEKEDGFDAEPHSISSRPPPPPTAAATAPTAPHHVSSTDEAPAATPAKSNKKLKIAAAVLLAVLLGGGALGLTPYGVFGTYALLDAYKAGDYEAAKLQTLATTRKLLARDTAQAATQALQQAEATHTRENRAAGVAAAAAYTGFMKELRFGRNAAQHAHSVALMGTLPPESTGGIFDLARAGQSVTSDQLARGQALIEAYVRRSPGDPDGVVLAGEIALLARDADRALEHWTKLATLEDAPRPHYGLARAHWRKQAFDKAEAEARKTLELEPNHAGAKLLLATCAWDAKNDEETASKLLNEIFQTPEVNAAASTSELVDAHTLLGRIHLKRSRVSAAENAFKEALKLDTNASAALSGMGEALYRAGRHAEALARFGSAMEADPEAIEPKVGVAKTKLALERLQEAKELLKTLSKKLKDENKPNPLVLSWLGRVEEAMGDKASAETDYNEAIALAGAAPDIIDTYVWLAQLLNGLGRPAEATAKLDEAKTKLPKTVTLHKALGDFAFQAGRYSEAEQQFSAALQLDPQDISTRFKLGTTLRRTGKFPEAKAAFEQVAEADKDFPGLALERAVLAEASGESARALELFEDALSKAPDDPDLMLRVAAALLAGNKAEQISKAEGLMRKVLQQRQNSAEANHFLGRALLLGGTNLAEAKRYLKRATELDANHAEYYLYVGWAANEADQQLEAAQALDKALDLDRSLADAYWQRGVLRRRQRSVIEAEQDLLKALELRPSRYAAYATLAEVYEDQQKWPQAIGAWQKAIAADGNRADWRFRLGKLYWQSNNRPSALEQLSQAVTLAAQVGNGSPAWLAEACLLLADAERAAGKKDQAIEHYQRFLSLAALDSPYRPDAEKALRSLGGSPRLSNSVFTQLVHRPCNPCGSHGRSSFVCLSDHRAVRRAPLAALSPTVC